MDKKYTYSKKPLKTFTLYNKDHTFKFPKLLVWLLVVSFLTAPAERVLAEEETDTEVVYESLNPTVLTDVAGNYEANLEEVDKNIESNTENVTEIDLNEITLNESSEIVISTTESDGDVIDILDHTDGVFVSDESDEVSALQNNEIINSSFEDVNVADASLGEIGESGNADTFTTNDSENIDIENVLEEVTEEPVMTIGDADQQVIFEKDKCVEVSGGSFYCHDSVASPVNDRPDGVYSLPDIDGDLEIYVQKAGVLTQITYNTVDDASPQYDSVSESLVWHRLIGDRFQIIDYNLAQKREFIVTEGQTNNVEPTKQGGYIAWQSWIENNWEIVLYDGKKMLRLTHSPQHDLSPQIKNGLLIWKKIQDNGEQTAELYNLKTGEYISIKDSDGGLVSNPRLMVMYESENATGDVVVKGYDMVTGEIIPINSNSDSVPEEIPLPDETGASRVILPNPNKNNPVTDGDLDVDGEDGFASTTDSSLLQYDFDDESDLIVFDYGTATSTDQEVDSEEVDTKVEEMTIDMRSTDEEDVYTIVLPVFNSSANEELSSAE